MLSESHSPRPAQEDPSDERTDAPVRWTEEAEPAQSSSAPSRGSQASADAGNVAPGQESNISSEPGGLLVGQNKHSDMIQQGSPLIRALASVGAVVSLILCALSIINPMVLFGSPIVWTIAAYQGAFSITTLVFEAKPEWIQAVSSRVDHYQDYVMSNAAFLATCLGRGLFYIFQGTLWGTVGHSLPADDNAPLEHFFEGCFQTSTRVLGLYLILLGIAYVLMHYNVLPQQYARKIRRGSLVVTERVANALENLRDRRAKESPPSSRPSGSSASVPLREGQSEVELPSR